MQFEHVAKNKSRWPQDIIQGGRNTNLVSLRDLRIEEAI